MTTATNGAGPHGSVPSQVRTATSSGSQRSSRPLPPPPRAPGPRGRRRPAFLALGVVLMVIGVLGGAWLVNAAGDRTSVVAVTRAVPFGSVITADDLTATQVSVDPSVATVPAEELDRMIGRVAATHLAPGSLLTPTAVTDAGPPEPGEVLVAIAVPATRMPAGSLQPGDRVLVVDTPPVDAEAPTMPSASLPATVVRLGEPDVNGLTVVDVTVNADDGPALAARSATERIALVLRPRGR